MYTNKNIPILLLTLICLAFAGKSYAQPCSVTSIPPYRSCFTEYFTSISATGDMGTTSSISVSASSCTGTYFDLYLTQGIDAPVGANVTLSFSRFTTHYTGYVSVYIDWDSNGQYDAYESTGFPATPRDIQMGPAIMDSVYNITLLCGTPAGTYRMRVMLSEMLDNEGAPCDTANYGQVYDFYYNSYCPPAPIAGTTLLCRNDTTTLTASYGCGVWTSSNAAIVAVGTSGVIGSGTATGTAIISYTSSACGTSSVVVTVAPLPISMLTPLCVGGTALAASAPAFGTWSIGSSYIAAITPLGAFCNVTGVHAGSTVLTYTFGVCSDTETINVLPGLSVGGDAIVCLGGTLTLPGVPPGGTWSSSNTAIATVDLSSGMVSGVAPGTVIITYSAPYGGCSGYKTITVEEVIIPPYTTVCVGASTTLTATPSGGTWSLDPSAEGMAITPGGVFSGLYVTATSALGSTVTYTSPAGCQAIADVYVEDKRIFLPAAICIGYSAQVLLGGPGLHGFFASGITLSSSNPSVATADSSTGLVTGIAAGTVIITYTSSLGCVATATVVISSAPVLPPVTVCTGATLDFSFDGDGTWSSSTPSAAPVGLTDGIVTGASAGTTNIIFAPTSPSAGCPVIHPVSVLTSPTVSGSPTVCQGGTTTYSHSGSSGFWSSSNVAVATVNSGGVVTGVSPGTAVISYTSGSCSGTQVIAVDAYVAVSGCSSVCTGGNCIFTPASGMTTCGSSNPAVATVTNLGGGSYRVDGISAGTALITFGTASCPVAASRSITVQPVPYVIGPTTVCPGAPITMTATPSGGTWTSDNASILTIHPSTGVVAYAGPGWTYVDYVSPAGCTRNDYAIGTGASISLTGSPTLDVCEGSTVGFVGSPPGGIWISSTPSKLSINITDGSAYGNSPGSVNLTYIAGACSQTRSLNVKPKPTMCRVTNRAEPGGAFGSWGAHIQWGFAWKFPSWDFSMRVWGSPGGGTFYPSGGLISGDLQSGPAYSSSFCPGFFGERITLMPDYPWAYTSITYTVDGCSVTKSIVVYNP